MRPMRVGSTRHSAALRRTRRTACWTSAEPVQNFRECGVVGRWVRVAVSDLHFLSRQHRRAARAGLVRTPARASTGTGADCSVRYFRTNAAMPLLFSHARGFDALVLPRQTSQRAAGSDHDGRAGRGEGSGR